MGTVGGRRDVRAWSGARPSDLGGHLLPWGPFPALHGVVMVRASYPGVPSKTS